MKNQSNSITDNEDGNPNSKQVIDLDTALEDVGGLGRFQIAMTIALSL